MISVPETMVSLAYATQGRSVRTWEALHLGTVPETGAPAVSVSVSRISDCVLVSGEECQSNKLIVSYMKN